MSNYGKRSFVQAAIDIVKSTTDLDPRGVAEIVCIFHSAEYVNYTVEGREIRIESSKGLSYFSTAHNPGNNTDLVIELVRTRFPKDLVQVIVWSDSQKGCSAFISGSIRANRKDGNMPLSILEAGLRAILKELPE